MTTTTKAMNTREREVMDALAEALRTSACPRPVGDDDGTSAGCTSCGCDNGVALKQYDALIAEGSASSEGAVYQIRGLSGSWLEVSKTFYELCAGDRRILYTHPQPAQGEHERQCGCGLATCVEPWEPGCGLGMSKEHAVAVEPERRPIADEVVLPELPTSAVYDPGRFGVMFSSKQLEDYAREAVRLNAHPRGLPAGSHAPTITVVFPGEPHSHAYVATWDEARKCYVTLDPPMRTHSLATAEQPSCGQDARDAARLQWSIEHARWIRHEHEAYVAIPVARDADLSCKATRIAAIDAAIAAQQRQGGEK